MALCDLSRKNVLPILMSMDVLEEDIDVILGKNLRRLRMDRNMSQDELAERIATPRSRISAIEHGRDGMGKAVLSRVCKALRASPYEFYLTKREPVTMSDGEKEALDLYRQAEELGIEDLLEEFAQFIIKSKSHGAPGGAKRRSPRRNQPYDTPPRASR